MPDDFSYSYGGYRPLIGKILIDIIKEGNIKQILKYLYLSISNYKVIEK